MGRLFDLHSAYVYSIAFSILKETDRAEAVLHEVFIRIWRTPADFVQSGSHLFVDLALLTRQHSINALQHRHLDRAVSTPPQLLVVDRLETVDLIPAHEHAKATLTRLPKQTRAALDLAFFGGCTLVEIAAVLGGSQKQIRKSISTGLLAFGKRP